MVYTLVHSIPKADGGRAQEKLRTNRIAAVQRVLSRRRPHRELPIDSISYDTSRYGEDVRMSKYEIDTHTVILHNDVAITSAGDSTVATVFSDTPSVVADWTQWADVFEEYRVLDMVVDFLPMIITGGSSLSALAPLLSVVDRNDATALTGYAAGEEFASCQEHSIRYPFRVHNPMSGVSDSVFESTASPANHRWTKFFSTGSTASITIGRVMQTFVVQFRGAGLT